DVGGLAAELEGQRLVRAGGGLVDQLADTGRAGERDLVDVRAADEVHADVRRPRDDVDDAGRQVRLHADLGEEQCAQRGGRGGLEDDRVAGGEGRRDLPGQHEQREVPGDDLCGDPERLRDPAGERVVELVGPAGVV